MRILVVEDDAVLAFMIDDALTDAGHEVLGPAATAGEAIRLADAFDPRLAIVDIDLHGERSGLDVARHVGALRGIPVLFSTGQVAIAKENADVAVGVLIKPYSPEAVVQAVAALTGVLSGRDAGLPPDVELF